MESVVLRLLCQHGKLFGRQISDMSDGEIKMGTVYQTLMRMEKKGYLVSEQMPLAPNAIGPPIRLYEATPLGRNINQAWQEYLLFWEVR